MLSKASQVDDHHNTIIVKYRNFWMSQHHGQLQVYRPYRQNTVQLNKTRHMTVYSTFTIMTSGAVDSYNTGYSDMR